MYLRRAESQPLLRQKLGTLNVPRSSEFCRSVACGGGFGGDTSQTYGHERMVQTAYQQIEQGSSRAHLDLVIVRASHKYELSFMLRRVTDASNDRRQDYARMRLPRRSEIEGGGPTLPITSAWFNTFRWVQRDAPALGHSRSRYIGRNGASKGTRCLHSAEPMCQLVEPCTNMPADLFNDDASNKCSSVKIPDLDVPVLASRIDCVAPDHDGQYSTLPTIEGVLQYGRLLCKSPDLKEK